MTCPNCNTDIERREIVFGTIGKIEIEGCVCEAERIQARHQQPNRKPVKRTVPDTKERQYKT